MKFPRILARWFGTLVLLAGCTSHPVVSPDPLKPGESYQGVLISVENVVPQLVYRRGLTPRMDAGFRLGLIPIHGSGADLSLLIRDEGKRVHTLNFAGTYAEQPSFEFSYINAKRMERSKKVRREGKVYKQTENGVFNYGYFGLRYAYLPRSFFYESQHLFGFVWGRNFKKEWGFELGYLQDFSSAQPHSDLGLDKRLAPLTGVFLRIHLGRLKTPPKD